MYCLLLGWNGVGVRGAALMNLLLATAVVCSIAVGTLVEARKAPPYLSPPIQRGRCGSDCAARPSAVAIP